MWTANEAQAFCQELWPIAEKHGWHFGLTGSVLYKGESQKDLDLVFYPRTRGEAKLKDLHLALEVAGLRQSKSALVRLDYWKRSGLKDTKHVESWTMNGKRIDVIITEAP